MRREKRDRLIPPVVQASVRSVVRIELEHRQQLDSADAQRLQIRDFLDQPGIGAASAGFDAGARMPRESPHVQFVDDGLDKRAPERAVSLPVVARGIGDDALHRPRRVVAWAAGGPAVVSLGHCHRAAVGIEQHLIDVEPQALGRREWAVDAIRVDLARLQPGYQRVPVVVGAVVRAARAESPPTAVCRRPRRTAATGLRWRAWQIR